MLRVLMVEDDSAHASALRACVERYCAEEDIEVSVAWERDALDLARAASRADLVFLDIDLPLVDGMEAASLLRVCDPETPIVFVTNMADQAVRGYEVDAVDFVVKPVRYESFRLRMRRAMRAVRRAEGQSVVVSTRDVTTVVPYAELAWAETSGHDALLHSTAAPEPILAHESLSSLQRRLDPGCFVRISGNCLVNMAFVRTISATRVVLATGESLAVSRRKREATLEAMNRYLGRGD